MARFTAIERDALAGTLLAAGPDAPTLCRGWQTRDLAAHLVLRFTRFDAAPGILLRPWSGYTRRVQASLARRPWADLVHQVRYPPAWTPLAWGPVDALVNLTEYFIHHEDVLRAQTGWTNPRKLEQSYEKAIWGATERSGRLMFRASPVGVRLTTPDGRIAEVHQPRRGRGSVTLTGEPGELLLYASGRTDHALVDVDGTEDDVAAFRQLHLRM